MEKEKIILTHRNRDGACIWLEHFKDNDYTIHTDENKKYVLEYVSVNYDELPLTDLEFDDCYVDQFGKMHKCKNFSFDPAGGPYMSIGMDINGKTLKRIYCSGTKGNKKTLFTLE